MHYTDICTKACMLRSGIWEMQHTRPALSSCPHSDSASLCLRTSLDIQFCQASTIAALRGTYRHREHALCIGSASLSQILTRFAHPPK